MEIMKQYKTLQTEIEQLLANGRNANMLNAEELEKLTELNQRQADLFKVIVDRNR